MEKLMKWLGFSKCQVCGKWNLNALGLFSKISVGSVCDECGWEQVSDWELNNEVKLGQNCGMSFNEYKTEYERYKAKRSAVNNG